MFNLPATPTICKRICPGCYAHREQTRFPSVLSAREDRYSASLSPDFASTIISEIKSIRKPFVAYRIHASGEFYSQVYVNKWTTIAKALPQVTFYAFTKRLHDFDFSAFMSLPNAILIDSCMHTAINYSHANSLLPNVPICPATRSKLVRCGIDCTYCMTKSAQANGIQFVKH